MKERKLHYFSDKYPLLCKHLESDTIWIENNNYVGEASDGLVVTLGSKGDEINIELYLLTHPDPSTW